MSKRVTDPAELEGEALARWYRRTPIEIEADRRAAGPCPMTSALEEYVRRPDFYCEWGPRGACAWGLAERLQTLAATLHDLEPAYGDLRLVLQSHPFNGPPLLGTPTEDLATVIDRRARFDPPPLPAPVGLDGYSVGLVADRAAFDPLSISVRLHAGAARPESTNSARLDIHAQSPVWADQRRRLALLDTLLKVFDPQWAYAGVAIPAEPIPGVRQRYQVSVSLTWRRPDATLYEGLVPAGSEAVVTPLRGGDLTSWS
jgi:hypothetical protein